MSNLPIVAIGVVTYKRTEMALRTILSTIENLQYPKDRRVWYIADDGSGGNHMSSILDLLNLHGEKIIGHHTDRWRHPGQENTHHAGIGWNKCLGICHQASDFVLWLEDDWELEKPFNLVPYVKLLQEREDVGMCSFRILSTGADVHTVGHTIEGYGGQIYLQYDRTTQYAYSGNPSLRHARYTKRYGVFAEDRNPGLIELHQDDQYRLAVGEDHESPRIWRPVDISVWGAWSHIGNLKSWE